MSDEMTLLPCPFCSSEPDLLESYGGWYIRCSCGVSMCENYSEGGFPVGEFVTEAEAIAAWNTRATHSALTAEQVREAIEKRFDFDVWVPAERWQAIADELNAELGSGTCELYYGEDDDGYDGWYCDECGGWFQAVRRDGHLVKPKHCQECGKAVKR